MKKLTLNEMITLMSTHIENQKEINLQGALYTEENVLHMLKSIVQPPSLPAGWQEEVATAIEDMIENEMSSEFVDYDDIDLRLHGNEINVECVGVDTRAVRRACEYLVNERINEILTFVEEVEEVEEVAPASEEIAPASDFNIHHNFNANENN
jgi:hypothetical protein